MKKIILVFLSLCVAAAVFVSCTNEPQTEKVPAVNQETEPDFQESTDGQENLPENTGEPEQLPEQLPEETVPLYVNPLTGLETEKDLTGIRPVAVMINNIHLALPQIGISEADIVYEILEEGGITRLLAIYNDYGSIPEIGSIRSARDYYIDISDAHDAIFVHSGGSTYAYSELAKRNTQNIDGIYMNQFYRSAERRKTMAKEHTLMISGAGLTEAIAQKGYRTTTESACPLVFGQTEIKQDAKSASFIEIPFSLGKNSDPYAVSFFNYNDETGEYLKGHFEKEHIDGDDNSQLSFTNVLTLSCPSNMIKGDPYGCIQVHFTGTGKGTYASGGVMREIVWKRSSRSSSYTLYESDGQTPLVITPGKSYIAVVPTGTVITAE